MEINVGLKYTREVCMWEMHKIEINKKILIGCRQAEIDNFLFRNNH